MGYWLLVIRVLSVDFYLSLLTSFKGITMFTHITFFSTLVGLGFLLGVISGTILGVI